MRDLLKAPLKLILPCKRTRTLSKPSSSLLLMIHYAYVTVMKAIQMKTVWMIIERTEAGAAQVGTMIATKSIVGEIERKNETEIAIVIETIGDLAQVEGEAVQNHDHGLILQRRRMAAVVAPMDVATVVQLLTVAEIIITARMLVVTQAITATATETLISGIIVITVIIGIGIEIVTGTVMEGGAAMAHHHHPVTSATVAVEEEDTMIEDLAAQAPATDRLSM